jgi:hypothetical protein
MTTAVAASGDGGVVDSGVGDGGGRRRCVGRRRARRRRRFSSTEAFSMRSPFIFVAWIEMEKARDGARVIYPGTFSPGWYEPGLKTL